MTLRLIRRATFGLAFACGLLLGSGEASAEKIVISNWDGYMPADLLVNFTKETGIEAEMSVHATNEEIMGKVVAGGGKGYDVLFISSPFVEALQNLQLIAPLDAAKIPNLANLYPEARALAYDPGNAHSVPYAWGTTGLCYRSDLIKTAPSSWMDLLKPSADIKGRITMLATDRWLMAAGEKALGYSVNTTNEDEIAKTKALLIEAKKGLLAYDDTTFYSKLVSSEAVLVQAWDGWCNYGIAEKPEIKYVIPKEGSDLWVDTMVVMKASEHKDDAFKFINFMLDAKNHAWAAQNIDYKVPNKPAMESLPADFLAKFPNMAMPVADLVKFEQLRDVGEAQRDYSKIVSEIKAAQ